MPVTSPLRGMTIAVGDHYARTLSVALPRNLRHLDECVVVTSPADDAVKAVASGFPNVRVLETDAFTRPDRNGLVPRFNKGLAAEEGFDFLGREGWILVFDADIVFPEGMRIGKQSPRFLYGARRRILSDPSAWSDSLNWAPLPIHPDDGPIGFFQLFHALDPAICGERPWYDVSFAHAGGCDARFMRYWKRSDWQILPIEVLHLGSVDTNWFGADQEGVDIMSAFVHLNGWRTAMKHHDPSAVDRISGIVDRVEVEGYEPSTFRTPNLERWRGRFPGIFQSHPKETGS